MPCALHALRKNVMFSICRNIAAVSGCIFLMMPAPSMAFTSLQRAAPLFRALCSEPSASDSPVTASIQAFSSASSSGLTLAVFFALLSLSRYMSMGVFSAPMVRYEAANGRRRGARGAG